MPQVPPVGLITLAVLVASSVAPVATAHAQTYNVTGIFTFNASNVAHAVNANGAVAGVKYPCCIDAIPAGFLWTNPGGEQSLTGPEGMSEFQLEGINGSGVGAGYGYFGEWPETYSDVRAVVSNGGTITDIGVPQSRAHDINDAMLVVGEREVSGQNRAFVADAALTVTTLGTLGGSVSRAYGVNNAGAVVGEAAVASGALHAFVSTGDYSTLVDLGTLGGLNSVAYDINSSGVAVGASQDTDGLWYPVVFQGGTVQKIGTQRGNARAINDQGAIVGDWLFTGAFRSIQGVTQDLHELIPPGSGWSLWNGNDINEAGQIVGRGEQTIEATVYNRGFVLNPITTSVEPGPAAALAIRAFPSVTREGSRLAFGRPLDSAGRVVLYDVAGRTLRTYPVAPGQAAIQWDGLDNAGHGVASGCVLVRLESTGQQATTRLFVTR